MPEDWSRPPEGLPSRSEVLGVAHRTRRNLEFIVAASVDHPEKVHVVTQIVLSLLGILIFPYERHLKRWGPADRLVDLEAVGWPKWNIVPVDGTRPTKLYQLIIGLRNAIAHENIAYSSDSRDPHEVTVSFSNCNRTGDVIYWKASIRADRLADFCVDLLKRIDDFVG